MRTINYELQGKEVPAALIGKIIKFMVPETYKEAESLTVNGEGDVVAKFADGDVIRRQGQTRNRAKKALKDANGDVAKAVAALQIANDAADNRYTIRAEGSGVSKPKTAKGRAESVAKSSGNKLFERLLGEVQAGNSANLDRLSKQGFVDRDEYNAWVEARAEAVKEAAAPKTPKTPKAPEAAVTK